MANVNRPSGLTPVRHLAGGHIRSTLYKKEASVILGRGDPVVLTGTSEAGTGIALVTRAQGTEGTATTITGVVVAIDPNRADLTKTYMDAADTGYVLVVDDPFVLFEIQDDGVADSTQLTDIGEASDLIVANANTTNGLSNVMVDASDITNGDQVQLLGVVQREDNVVASAYCRVIVRINEHTFHSAGTII